LKKNRNMKVKGFIFKFLYLEIWGLVNKGMRKEWYFVLDFRFRRKSLIEILIYKLFHNYLN
jgi:hypothetical protein